MTFVSCEDNAPQSISEIQHYMVQDANIILLTLDGVRYEEFFNKDIFKNYWLKYAKESIVLGDPKHKSKLRVANPLIFSLPAYKTMHLGARTLCFTNKCTFTKKETLSEKLIRVNNWHYTKVAVISSWFKVCYAATQSMDNILHSCGQESLDLIGHEKINIQQKKDPPNWNGRKDKYTFAHGMKFIENNKPRFLHLSLLDSDEHAHQGEWDKYISSLRTYDLYINRLFTLLTKMKDYGSKTTVIITTDHGRGKGKKWKSHGTNWHARKIWMTLRGPDIPQIGSISHKREINHLHIRPFIEMLLGIDDIKGAERINKLLSQNLAE